MNQDEVESSDLLFHFRMRSFHDSSVWLAIPNQKSWFEGDLKVPVADRAQTEELVSQLRSSFLIVEELDLNTPVKRRKLTKKGIPFSSENYHCGSSLLVAFLS
jgi:hypothetical protein